MKTTILSSSLLNHLNDFDSNLKRFCDAESIRQKQYVAILSKRKKVASTITTKTNPIAFVFTVLLWIYIYTLYVCACVFCRL